MKKLISTVIATFIALCGMTVSAKNPLSNGKYTFTEAVVHNGEPLDKCINGCTLWVYQDSNGKGVWTTKVSNGYFYFIIDSPFIEFESGCITTAKNTNGQEVFIEYERENAIVRIGKFNNPDNHICLLIDPNSYRYLTNE